MFEELIQKSLGFLKGNPLSTLAIAGLVAAFFYFKPKEAFKLFAFVAFLVAAFYVITLLVSTVGTGSQQKDTMIYKTRDTLGH